MFNESAHLTRWVFLLVELRGRIVQGIFAIISRPG